MEIKDIAQKAHDNAVKHGFWDPPLPFGTAIALIHSELSEALEEERAGNPLCIILATPAAYARTTATKKVSPVEAESMIPITLTPPVPPEAKSPKEWPWNWPTP